jgi:hypothetical protein
MLGSGANPTTSGANASAVKYYNAASSLACFENKNIFLCNEKRFNLCTSTLALYVVVNSGLASEFTATNPVL